RAIAFPRVPKRSDSAHRSELRGSIVGHRVDSDDLIADLPKSIEASAQSLYAVSMDDEPTQPHERNPLIARSQRASCWLGLRTLRKGGARKNVPGRPTRYWAAQVLDVS